MFQIWSMVLNGVELELVYNFFISCSIREISQVEVQQRHIGDYRLPHDIWEEEKDKSQI